MIPIQGNCTASNSCNDVEFLIYLPHQTPLSSAHHLLPPFNCVPRHICIYDSQYFSFLDSLQEQLIKVNQEQTVKILFNDVLHKEIRNKDKENSV